jgi:hypothetical protein
LEITEVRRGQAAIVVQVKLENSPGFDLLFPVSVIEELWSAMSNPDSPRSVVVFNGVRRLDGMPLDPDLRWRVMLALSTRYGSGS